MLNEDANHGVWQDHGDIFIPAAQAIDGAGYRRSDGRDVDDVGFHGGRDNGAHGQYFHGKSVE